MRRFRPEARAACDQGLPVTFPIAGGEAHARFDLTGADRVQRTHPGSSGKEGFPTAQPLRRGDHEIELIVELERRGHLHDLLRKQAIAGQQPLDVCAMRLTRKRRAPAAGQGGNDDMRHGKRCESFAQPGCIANEIERDGAENVLTYKIAIPSPRKKRIALKTWLFGFRP